jgi:hypothetical protein
VLYPLRLALVASLTVGEVPGRSAAKHATHNGHNRAFTDQLTCIKSPKWWTSARHGRLVAARSQSGNVSVGPPLAIPCLALRSRSAGQMRCDEGASNQRFCYLEARDVIKNREYDQEARLRLHDC